MRELVIEKMTYLFKRRKPKQKDYDVKDYLGGLSFGVNERDIESWRTLLILRYFGHFGGCDDADIKLIRKVDKFGNVLQERLDINSVGYSSKNAKQLTITIYRTTLRIHVQGSRKNDWVEKEMKTFHNAILQSQSVRDAVIFLEIEMRFTVPNMDEIMRESEVCTIAKQLATDIVMDVNDMDLVDDVDDNNVKI